MELTPPVPYRMSLTAAQVEELLLSIYTKISSDTIRTSLGSPDDLTIPTTKAVADAIAVINSDLEQLGDLALLDELDLGSTSVAGVLPISKGGTGAVDLNQAQVNLGIVVESAIQQMINNSVPTIQSIDLSSAQATGILPISKGGTGTNNVGQARQNLGVWSSEQSSAAIFETLGRSYSESGLNLVSGSFETGAVLEYQSDCVLQESEWKAYTWDGPLPKTVDVGSSPSPIGAGAWIPAFNDSLRLDLSAQGGSGLIGDISKPITWEGFSGGAKGDSVSNSAAITAANASGNAYSVPSGYWPNTVDATFNIYPEFRNYSGGLKLKRGLPGSGTQNPYPLIWAEKTSNMQRVDGGTKWFDVALQGALTLEATATAFGVGVSGYVRSSAGDVLTSGKFVDAIAVHGSGRALGRNGRVWGLWGQAVNGDDGSGIRSSSLIGCELNLVNQFDSQPHPENLPVGEGSYRGLIVTTADDGKACGIGIDVGDGSGRALTESGWWIGLRLRKGGILPAGDWKNSYLEDTQQLKIEGSLSNTHRYGGIRIGPRFDGTGVNFTYGLNVLGSVFQDFNAINLGSDHRIYWGPVGGVTRWIGYEASTTCFNIRNMPLSINSVRVLSERQTGIFQLTGTPDGTTKNTETMTLVELSRYVKKLSDALITHGMIGPT